MCPCAPSCWALEIHRRARTARVGAVMPNVQPSLLLLT
jgi:hypothetical protein